MSQPFNPTAHPQSCARLISIKGCLGRDSFHFNPSAKCRQPSPNQLPSSAACQQHGPGSSPPKATHPWHRVSSCLHTTCKATSPHMETRKAWVFNSRIPAHLLYPLGGTATSLSYSVVHSPRIESKDKAHCSPPVGVPAALSFGCALIWLLQPATATRHPSREGRSKELWPK